MHKYSGPCAKLSWSVPEHCLFCRFGCYAELAIGIDRSVASWGFVHYVNK